MSVALAIEPAGSATCNVRTNDDEKPLSVIAGTEGSALAIVKPGQTVTVQAVGVNGSCKWRITSAAGSESP